MFADLSPRNSSSPSPDLLPPALAPRPNSDAVALTNRLAELQARLDAQAALLDHRERQIEALRKINDALFGENSVDSLVKQTLEVALDVSRGEAGSMQLFDADRQALVFKFVVGPAAQQLQGFEMPISQRSIASRVFKSGAPELTHHARSDKEFNTRVDEEMGFITQSMMTVPVKRPNGQPLGVMQILNGSDSFDARDLEVVSALSDAAAMAIEQARLQDSARQAQIVSLLGDISHDIKNMLTPIVTGASTLQWLLDDTFARIETIGKSEVDSLRALRQITDALDIVRFEYGWILDNSRDAAERVQSRTREIADAIKGEISPPNFECAPLQDVFYEVARSLTPVADRANVRLFLEFAPELPHVAHDRKMLYNALYNLVNNAIPETPDKGSVTMSARQLDEKWVCLQVSDTGRGMPDHVREKLFTDRAISTKPGGTGLGTRIVWNVVRSHGGSISVDSKPDFGTTFTMHLPLQQCG